MPLQTTEPSHRAPPAPQIQSCKSRYAAMREINQASSCAIQETKHTRTHTYAGIKKKINKKCKTCLNNDFPVIQCSSPASFGESQVLALCILLWTTSVCVDAGGAERRARRGGAPHGNVKQFFSANHTAGGYGIGFLKFGANQRPDMNAIIPKRLRLFSKKWVLALRNILNLFLRCSFK